jgi:essential nuclear protein 1
LTADESFRFGRERIEKKKKKKKKLKSKTMPKTRKRRGKKHDPLEIVVRNEETVEFVRRKNREKGERRQTTHQQDESYVPASLSEKILRQAEQQMGEENSDASDNDDNDDNDNDNDNGARAQSSSSSKSLVNAISLSKLYEAAEEMSESESENDHDFAGEDYHGQRFYGDDDDDDDVDEIEVSAEDARALRMFMSQDAPIRRTLHDVIMERIREVEEEEAGDAGPQEIVERYRRRMDPRVFNVYRGVGRLMRTYKSGRLPKALKLMPRLENWEDLLWLTEPDEWSPAAVYYATRIFASNLNAKMAQRFFNLILLPRVRADFAEHKKLHFHHYIALKKALYKSGAFYKGFLLPLCEDRDCTLKEALVIGSVLQKCHVPVLHSAAALMRIASMPYCGANSIFMRILLDKKYALPYPVIDAVVDHFLRFVRDERHLPVLWHQSMLVFAQRYKTQITKQQKQQLRYVLHKHTHRQITPLVRRELFESLSRGERPQFGDQQQPERDSNRDYRDERNRRRQCSRF